VPARRGLSCESWSSRGQLAPGDAGGPEGAAPMLVRRSVTRRLGEALQEAVLAEERSILCRPKRGGGEVQPGDGGRSGHRII
jgi:hypothetical protein